jgi:hypothetical protein
MPKPVLKKQPIEIFGIPYLEGAGKLKAEIQQQYCPFINGTCVKPRKSEPHIKVGICSLGYKTGHNEEYEPVIVCPQRFKEKAMFDAVRKNYLSHWTNIEWITEVSMGVGGSIDYVAITTEPIAKRSFAIPTELVGCVRNTAGRAFGASRMLRCSTDALGVRLAAPHAASGVEGADVSPSFARGSTDRSGKIVDFFCVEIQAAGTTGSPYPAITDIKNTGTFQRDSYNFGINWANEFSKTMMQQAYKKGKIVNHWGRKIIFVLQNVGLQYIKSACDTSKLQSPSTKLPIDFCTFKMNWNDTQNIWGLEFDAIASTDVDGINRMLGGVPVHTYPTENEFIENIIRKGIADQVLDKRQYSNYTSPAR